MLEAGRYSCVVVRYLIAVAVLILLGTAADAQTLAAGFNHSVILKSDGTVVAAGPLEAVLTEDVVSSTFGMPIRLAHEDGRWAARRRDPRVRA